MLKKLLFTTALVLSQAHGEPLENALKRIHLNPNYQSDFNQLGVVKKVAVIDTGYDRNNKDLREVVDISKGIIPLKTNLLPDDMTRSALMNESIITYSSDKDFNKQSSHGTHVAGIAAAAFGDVSSLDDRKPILPVKISKNRKDASNFINVLEQLRKNDEVSVVNLSWGFGGEKGLIALDKGLEKAMLETMEAGKIIVLAAGNNGALYNTDTYTKSIFELAEKAKGRLIVVGASENKDGKEVMANFSALSSNKMAPYFVTAPGVNIESFLPISLQPEGKGEKSGTSMAAPLVAGAIGRLVTDFPQLSIDQISEIVRSTCQKQYRPDGTVYNRFGNGIVDMEAARTLATAEVLKLHLAKTPDVDPVNNPAGKAPLVEIEHKVEEPKVEATKDTVQDKTLAPKLSEPVKAQPSSSWRTSLWNGIVNVGSALKSGVTAAASYIKSKLGY